MLARHVGMSTVDDTSHRTFHDAWSGNPTLVAGTPVTIVIEKK